MTYTDKDEKTIIEGQKQDIAYLNQQLNQEIAKQATRDRAMNHVRVAMDEAIAMAKRSADLPVTEGDKAGARRRSEAVRLVAYFNECKRSFEDELGGKVVAAVAEKVVVDESTGNHTGKGN